MTNREVILLALDMLILKLEDERRENTFSAIQNSRLAAARRARDEMASAASAEPA